MESYSNNEHRNFTAKQYDLFSYIDSVPGDEEEIVNEQEQNEIVNEEEESQTTNANG